MKRNISVAILTIYNKLITDFTLNTPKYNLLIPHDEVADNRTLTYLMQFAIQA